MDQKSGVNVDRQALYMYGGHTWEFPVPIAQFSCEPKSSINFFRK